MTDRAEIAVGDQIERLLAAIVRMNPPADVRQQARGMAQPAIFGGFPQLRDPDQPVGPSDQFLGMASGARQQFVQRLRGADQPVLCSLPSGSIEYSRPSRTPKVENIMVFGLAMRMMYSSTSAA